MRMEIPAGLCVDKTNHVVIFDKSDGAFRVEFRFIAIWVEEPIIIGVFVVVARHLLLIAPFGVSLDV